MKKNMGITDRVIRVLAAIVIAALYFTNIITGALGIVLMIAAIVFLLTSLVKVCPVYMPFGINTCRTKESK